MDGGRSRIVIDDSVSVILWSSWIKWYDEGNGVSESESTGEGKNWV